MTPNLFFPSWHRSRKEGRLFFYVHNNSGFHRFSTSIMGKRWQWCWFSILSFVLPILFMGSKCGLSLDRNKYIKKENCRFCCMKGKYNAWWFFVLSSDQNTHSAFSMTSLKRRSPLVLTAVLLQFFIPTVAKVVNSISECDQFLLEKTPPQVPGILERGIILNQTRNKTICQTFENKARFVTLYDIENKIPVFSAYKYSGEKDKRRPKTLWKIEPEVGFFQWLIINDWSYFRHTACLLLWLLSGSTISYLFQNWLISSRKVLSLLKGCISCKKLAHDVCLTW